MLGVVAGLSLLAASCVASREVPISEEQVGLDRGFKFSHALHLENGLDDCSVCHDPTADPPSVLSAAGHDLCSVCHEIPESGTEVPADPVEQEKCAFCHTRPDYSVSKWEKQIAAEVKWQHAPHIDAAVECSTCHTQLDTRSLPATPLKPFCMDCHQQTRPALNECSVCHSEISMDAIPQHRNGQRIAHDSREIWTKIHGKEARVDAAYCAMCHETQNRCDDCHSVTPPSNHTTAWKNRSHGFLSSWDRNSCAVCHEEQFCVKCHKESEPVSHRAGWGEPRNGHCVNCHFPAERSKCTMCHEDIEHEEAMFSPHTLGIYPPNCARCHPGGLPHLAPHLSNSTVACIVCHK